jgi:hypothetical protein
MEEYFEDLRGYLYCICTDLHAAQTSTIASGILQALVLSNVGLLVLNEISFIVRGEMIYRGFETLQARVTNLLTVDLRPLTCPGPQIYQLLSYQYSAPRLVREACALVLRTWLLESTCVTLLKLLA